MFGYVLLAAGAVAAFVMSQKEEPKSQELSVIPTFGMNPASPEYAQLVWLIQNGSADQMEKTARFFETQPGGKQVADYIRSMAKLKYGQK